MPDTVSRCDYNQFNYGGDPSRGIVVEFSSREEALAKASECAVASMIENKEVYRPVEYKPSSWSGYQSFGYFRVESFPECKNEAVFDSWSSEANRNDAKSCAEALNLWTGQDGYFYAKKSAGFFVDYWKVVNRE